jgi:hypothetical protein
MSIHTSIWRAIDVKNLDKMLSILYLLFAILCPNHNCDGTLRRGGMFDNLFRPIHHFLSTPSPCAG